MRESKTIILCADDFGLNSGVSQGILKLARMGRLSATSCMVNMPGFTLHAQELLALKAEIQIGLHLNLTEGYLLSEPNQPCFPLNELLIKSHLHALKPALIVKELHQQLDRFVDVMGCLPDFIDGHQHIHQFPCIRPVVLQLYEQRLRAHGTLVRSTYPAVPAQFKAKVLAWTGGKALQAQLIKLAIPHNPCFSGIYDFAGDTDYRALFRSWLSLVRDTTLIMCHPGERDSEPDAIAYTRVIEQSYFSSAAFLEDCEEYGVRLFGHVP